MKFIEMSGKQLLKIINDGEVDPKELAAAGVKDLSIIRINQQGDIEIRRREGWDVIGGLIGEFEHRLHHETGLDWA
ncbi:MAG: hypothetical protein U0836_17015 [Pirellulales bacterium]